MISLEFCPYCGKKTLSYPKSRFWACSECGLNLYNNVAAAVGLIFYIEGCVLFERRAKEPKKGFLTLPGGFVDPDESAEEACFRESQEEIGIVPDSVQYIASYPNTYEYKDIVYKTCDMFFIANFSGKKWNNSTETIQGFDNCENLLQKKAYLSKENFLATLKAQRSEVTGFELLPVADSTSVDSLPIAFPSAVRALKRFLQMNTECDSMVDFNRIIPQ